MFVAFIAGKILTKMRQEKNIIEDSKYLKNKEEERKKNDGSDKSGEQSTGITYSKNNQEDDLLESSKFTSQTIVHHIPTNYEKKIKPVMDSILSFVGLVVLSPLYVLIAIVIYLDDPGPVLFTQKRIGKDKQPILIHKFRSMKMSTPHDVPTHELKNPELYITRVGKLLRRMSLDEIPQFWDVFRRRMSLVGPRPALWNQNDLVVERDKYGANDIMPGLTGWAQINGRDELEIKDKAKLDGEYVKQISLKMDVKCLVGTIKSVVRSEGVVEGGTGELNKRKSEAAK